MNFLNAASEKKKLLKVELTIAQKWEIILMTQVQHDDQGIIRAFKANYRKGVVRHCSASHKQHGKIIMPNMKEAKIFIREAWKMVSNQTIYN